MYVHPGVGRAGYEMTQVVTDRRRSAYSSFLLIYNASHLPGTHTYTFIVTNYEGTSTIDFQTRVRGMFYWLLFVRPIFKILKETINL